jgi:hypothetical protein
MSITPMPPAKAKGARFEHGSVLGGKTRGARVSSQWKSTVYICERALNPPQLRAANFPQFHRCA